MGEQGTLVEAVEGDITAEHVEAIVNAANGSLLGGKYSVDNRPGGVRAANPLFGTENLIRAAPLLDTLRQVADAHHVRPAQAALAWLLSLPQVVVIPGASSVEQLEFNVTAADLTLDEASLTALTEAARAFTPVSAARTLIDGLRDKFGI